jgi:hypothetical protein
LPGSFSDCLLPIALGALQDGLGFTTRLRNDAAGVGEGLDRIRHAEMQAGRLLARDFAEAHDDAQLVGIHTESETKVRDDGRQGTESTHAGAGVSG